MLEIACYAIALTAAAWALWVRRGTWGIPWETPTTRTIMRLAVALVLIAPAAEPVIGKLLFEVFGKWHLNDMWGHMLELGALATSTLGGMLRMPAMRQRIASMLWQPFVVGSAAMLLLFWHSSVTHNPDHDLFRLPHDWWLNAYFGVFWTVLVYYGVFNAWVALAHLRADPRSRPVALTWLACVGLGAVAMLGWLLPWLHWGAWYDYGRIAMCASVTAYAIASARSWQRKLDQWRGLITVTGARL